MIERTGSEYEDGVQSELRHPEGVIRWYAGASGVHPVNIQASRFVLECTTKLKKDSVGAAKAYGQGVSPFGPDQPRIVAIPDERSQLGRTVHTVLVRHAFSIRVNLQ